MERINKESKGRFNETISMMIKKAKNDATFNDYSKLLDELSDEASRNGFNTGYFKRTACRR